MPKTYQKWNDHQNLNYWNNLWISWQTTCPKMQVIDCQSLIITHLYFICFPIFSQHSDDDCFEILIQLKWKKVIKQFNNDFTVLLRMVETRKSSFLFFLFQYRDQFSIILSSLIIWRIWLCNDDANKQLRNERLINKFIYTH